MKKLPPRAENLRRALAQEAARIMSEHGIRDFLTAKRKAAERFGVTDGSVLPKNREIEDALAEYHRLFGGTKHGETLAGQRNAALSAMQMLADFEPRLVGSVLAVIGNYLYVVGGFGPSSPGSNLNMTMRLDMSTGTWTTGPTFTPARADEVLARIALAERANDKVRNLSGGQMRRVEIARALLHRPRLLVLDEPTVGLDIKSRADILKHVRRLVAEDGVSVLWATHLIDEVVDDDDVIVLHQGRVLAHGAASRVVAAADAGDIRAAFTRLTKDADLASEAT
jgi:ABC-type dipeptide/oligopeptide/nickel transport system ATPase component